VLPAVCTEVFEAGFWLEVAVTISLAIKGVLLKIVFVDEALFPQNLHHPLWFPFPALYDFWHLFFHRNPLAHSKFLDIVNSSTVLSSSFGLNKILASVKSQYEIDSIG